MAAAAAVATKSARRVANVKPQWAEGLTLNTAEPPAGFHWTWRGNLLSNPRPVAKFPHGQHIFIYSHKVTNQVVYSLSKAMNNHDAIKMTTFVGKKTVPRALRKDLWAPLCVLSFPSNYQGLAAYRSLREFKMMHETMWTVHDPQRPSSFIGLPKVVTSAFLMNQKANAIADIAAVLEIQGREPTESERLRALKRITQPEGKKKKPRKGWGSDFRSETLDFQGTKEGISVRWRDMTDALHARSWPAHVLHGPLQIFKHQPVWPPMTGGQMISLGDETKNTQEGKLGSQGLKQTA